MNRNVYNVLTEFPHSSKGIPVKESVKKIAIPAKIFSGNSKD